jgi:hypothetical protein
MRLSGLCRWRLITLRLPGYATNVLAGVVARASHDLGLAAWFGGAAMGAVGMNAATREVDDHTQRLRVANAGWFRWAPVVGLAASAHLAGVVARSRLDAPRWGHPRAGGLGILRAVLTMGAVVATLETGRSGYAVVRAGDVPVSAAVIPVSDTPDEVRRAQARLRVAQWLVPAFTAGIAVTNAVQEERCDHAPLVPGLR